MREKLLELPFDQYQRYDVLKNCIGLFKNYHGRNRIRVLDVGGFPGLIKDFLEGDDVVISDIVQSDMENYVQADGTDLPFADASFDVVTSADVIEHLPQNKRETFVRELLRTSSDLVVLIAPFKRELTELMENLLYEYVSVALGEQFRRVRETEGKQTSLDSLKEHIDNGLSEPELVKNVFREAQARYISFPSGYLYNWITMMLVKHYLITLPGSDRLHQLTDKLYNLTFSPKDHRAPAYRTVFVASKKGEETLLKKIEENYRIEEDSDEEISRKLQFFGLLFELFGTERVAELDQRVAELERQLTDQRQKNIELESQLKMKDEHLANYEQWIKEIQSKLSYRIYSKLKRRSSGGESEKPKV